MRIAAENILWVSLEHNVLLQPMVAVFAVFLQMLRERTEHLDIFLFFRPSLKDVLFPMFCLLVEGEYQILVF